MSQGRVREALEQFFERAKTREAAHVFTKVLTGTARVEADAADARARAGLKLGPLDGMLVSVKDLFDMQGEVTTAGSVLLKDAAPATADAPAIAALRRAGAVLVGRTNMSEFAFSGLGLNPHYGTPGSAGARDRAPGGSTSGGAVSVGLGLVPLTIGSDTGGSTRIPAAFNGIVGFKPTSPRIARSGAFPLSYTLDSVGPLARSVADCAAADAVMAGHAPAPLEPVGLQDLRIAVPRGTLFDKTEPAVSEAFEAALERLGRAGARIRPIHIDPLIEAMRAALAEAPIVACEAAAIHATHIAAAPERFDQRVLKRILGGFEVPARAYVQALQKRAALMPGFAALIAEVDCLALPTCPIVPPLIAPLEADPDLFAATNLMALRNTSVFNFFDCPALSLPLPVAGLPVGLMLASPPMTDHRLLALGAAVERCLCV